MSAVRLLTPPGAGGVAVLGLPAAHRPRLEALVDGGLPAVGGVRVVGLRAGGELLDEALVCAPGPDELELHVHASPALVDELLALLGGAGQAPARAAGGTLEALARARLAAAPSEAGARILLDQAEGALRRELERVATLTDAPRATAIDELLARAALLSRLLEPAVVVLAGPTNAGKSTLFNVLVGGERVVVSAEAGTTRDTISGRARLGPWPVELVDTAGERALSGSAAADRIEREGQVLARSAQRRADLVLWLDPADAPAAPAPELEAPCVALRSRADRLAARPRPGRALSALVDPEGARRVVLQAFLEGLGLPSESPWHPGQGVPFDARQREALAEARSGSPERAAELLECLLR